MPKYYYIEISDDAQEIKTFRSYETKEECLADLKKYFEAPDGLQTLGDLGVALQYTYGWGENDIKVGHVIRVEDDKKFTQIW